MFIFDGVYFVDFIIENIYNEIVYLLVEVFELIFYFIFKLFFVFLDIMVFSS